MNIKKTIILIVGLVLPVGIFLFLKFFGENKFEVQPLFQTELPANTKDCRELHLPYVIPAEIVAEFSAPQKSLNVVLLNEDLSVLSRVFDQFGNDPVNITQVESGANRNGLSLKNCIFLLHSPFDVVLFDDKGVIRGQYFSGDRDEIDRLIIELSIILNK